MKKQLKRHLNRYVICSTLLLVHLLFTVDTNIFQLLKVKSEIRQLKKDNSLADNEIKDLQLATKELTTNIIAREKYARENYFMKKQDEDIFVFLEK